MTALEPPGGARIIDRGYRSYDGPRTGVPGAIRSVAKYTARWVLGLGRPARSKVLPVLAAAIAFIPAIVFVGIAAFVPEDQLDLIVLPTYGEYYGFITSALIVFVAFAAPEALCGDRRHGMLGLYLASPLDRHTYLLGKGAAVAGLLSIATIGPPLLMLVAYTLQGIGPDGPVDVVSTFLRIVLSGSLVAVFYTAVSLGVSSLTDRRAVASAGVILLVLVTGAVTGALTNPGGVAMTEQINAANLVFVPFELVRHIFRNRLSVPDLSFAEVIGAYAAWVALGFSTAFLRYRKLAVTR
jgi:ABC-2 type transport system permease protein